MPRPPHQTYRAILAALAAAGVLSACGGGEGSDNGAADGGLTSPSNTSLNLSLEPNAPTAVDQTATDGFNWFNYRRQQAGLSVLTRDVKLDQAAQGHSEYQRLNNVISHEQTPGAPGYTGAELGERIRAAGYVFTANRYAYGEVISATGSLFGFAAAEDLITAIYHRFAIFEPTFSKAGGGFASVDGGYTYFTTNFTADGLDNGLGPGRFVTWPFAGQRNTPLNFMSDREIPDPVIDRNEVGYPISVHADITSTVLVTEFSVRPVGGNALSVRLLSRATDPETPMSAAAIVPLDPLMANTTYEVRFFGSVDSVPVSTSWTFVTR